MQAKRLKMFTALYAKEMRDLAAETIIVAGLAVVVNLFLFFKLNHTPYAHILVLPNLMLLGLAAFLPFISSFKLIYREWKSNTIYMLLSLPVKGALVLGAKMAALVTNYIAGTLAVLVSGFIVSLALVGEEIQRALQTIHLTPGVSYGQLLGTGLLFYLLSIAGLIYLVSISFGSQIVGKLVRGYSGLVTLLVFLALLFTIQDLGLLVGNELVSFLGIDFSIQWTIDAFNQFLLLFIAALLGVSTLIYAGTVWIYNRRIEL
ncbi:MAG TPA: hypothetical protein DER33_07420 [Syntrophomonas sp.]|jgi:hypothetical protein|nr:hypothetical protein [Syntrophomonas sp.]